MQKVRNRSHNILFIIQKLADVLGKIRSFFAERDCEGGSPAVAGSQMVFRGADAVYGD